MKYIKQIYEEGLGYTFYKRPLNYINKNIKNKQVLTILSILLKIIYPLIAIIVAIILFYLTFPFI